MNEKISVKSNYIYNTIIQVLILIVPLITTPYVSRVLGAENIGRYSFASAMVTYFSVFAAFGSTTYGQRSIAYYRENKCSLSEIFWNVFSFRLITSGIALLGYILFLVATDNLNLISVLFTINILNIIVDISWFFQGIELFKNIVLRNLIIKIISTLSVFLFVKSENHLWIYVLIVCGSTAVGNMSLWTMVFTRINKPTTIHPFYGAKDMLMIFLPTIATQVYMILDKTMIGVITQSNYANGCYEQAEKIARMALTIVTSVGVVVLPRVANLYYKDNLEQAKVYIYKAYRFVWMLALPIMFGLLSVSSVLIPVFLGKGFDDAIPLLMIFSMLVLFVSLSYITGISYLIPTKQQNIYTVAVTVSAALNIVMNVILIPYFSAVGAAIASVTAEALGCIIQISYCCKTNQFRFKDIIAGSWKYWIASIVMAIVVFFLKTSVKTSLSALVLTIIIASVVYFSLLLFFRDEFVLMNLKRAILILRKRMRL